MMKRILSASVTEDKMLSKLYFCIMVDHQTIEDNTVTIRDRDTMKQDRVAIAEIEGILIEKLDIRKVLG